MHRLPEGLAAHALMNDKRIAEAKRLLHEAVAEHKQHLTGIRPPMGALKQTYDQMLADMAKSRGGKLWFPYLGSGFGNGALVELADGSVKYDFICGIGVHYWGHSHPDLIDAAIDTALTDTVMQGHLQQNLDSLDLISLLTKSSGLDYCFLTTSGAMANENALKIAFQRHYPAYRVLAFDRCFVGRTLTVSQISDKPSFREGLPHNTFVDYVPFFDPSHPEESTMRTLEVIRKYLARYPNQHAAMCFELIQGEGGFYVGSREFFKAIVSLLRQHQIAVFIDEVQSFGRTPELFAFQYFGLESLVDIVTIGKLSQVCATLFREDYKPKPGLLSQTFSSSTAAIRASLTILNGLLRGGYLGPEGKIQKLHQHFVKQLEEMSSRYPHLVRGPFGIGCMVAFTPYDGDTQRVTQFVHRLFEAGVISFIAGSNPTRTRFLLPAGAVTFEDIDQVVKIIEQTLLQPL